MLYAFRGVVSLRFEIRLGKMVDLDQKGKGFRIFSMLYINWYVQSGSNSEE